MKRKPPSRAAEELYVAIRESMTRSGVCRRVSSSLVAHQQGNTFLVMMDLTTEAGRPRCR
jgi:hypothetical protein